MCVEWWKELDEQNEMNARFDARYFKFLEPDERSIQVMPQKRAVHYDIDLAGSSSCGWQPSWNARSALRTLD